MATFKKVGTIHTFKDEFIKGMLARDYGRDFAERCFSQIQGFGTYGFPESHAASFALLVYCSAWLKRYYPDVFATALLNSQPMGFYAPAQLVRDARQHGVEVRPIDVNASAWDHTLEALAEPPHPALSRQARQGELASLGYRIRSRMRMGRGSSGVPVEKASPSPLAGEGTGVKGLFLQKTAMPCALACAWLPACTRRMPRAWLRRGGKAGRSSRRKTSCAGQSLTQPPCAPWRGPMLSARSISACAKRFGMSRGLRRITCRYSPHPSPLPAQARLGELASLECPHPQADADGRGDAVATGTPCSLSHEERVGVRGATQERGEPELPPLQEEEAVTEDYSTFGLSLRNHPMAFVRGALRAKGANTAAELKNLRDGRPVKIAGLVLFRQRPGTAKGTIFVTIEDETGTANLIVWPKTAALYRRAVFGAKALLCEGVLQKESNVIHVVSRHLTDWTPMLKNLQPGQSGAAHLQLDRDGQAIHSSGTTFQTRKSVHLLWTNSLKSRDFR